MNKTLPSLVLSIGLLLLPLAFPTVAEGECFLESANGQQIDLSRLCGSETGPKPNQIFELPILRRVGGVPTVRVTFNARHRYEMLFDTGASGIVVTEEMAAKIGVKRERAITVKTAAGTVTAYLGRIASVGAGDITIKNPVISIAPGLEDLGLLGQSFFSAYDVTIKRDVIELRPRR